MAAPALIASAPRNIAPDDPPVAPGDSSPTPSCRPGTRRDTAIGCSLRARVSDDGAHLEVDGLLGRSPRRPEPGREVVVPDEDAVDTMLEYLARRPERGTGAHL